ncbi:alpha/beta hydrolase [Actinoalloteichus hymeniacidonis]|uniref:Alpha/beta hydrolase family protein n=1 Tax=Actinoalloteichus hymeniacidonis TaxID=340345 RepID=A0AAC9N021_9PSEU|nr:alpha/beta hydrolase [Actinoalloteichus hymeniacidonis]AOS66043.1 alpha/beta hydrolase family protein [Actinoalloteichus hymeniacidonis]MBB5905854.1 pimeloyl-ACP methyl ester carboxylesterase [Actinoalloteichus hymeniacidonis]
MRRSVLTVVTAAVVTSLTPMGAAAATPGSLEWGDCPEGVASPGLECTTLDVPLDYRDPHGEQIEIAISRLASKNPEQRRGVLLTNAGGPGGESLIFPAAIEGLDAPQEVLDSYDIIGFDPRGVGHSTPVTCGSAEGHFTNIPLYAPDEATVDAQAEASATVAEACGSSESAALLPHITTANTARDMDRIRAALGESTVSYFGVSYGTYLGSVYTTMFPERSDRFLLDSATGPGGWDAEFSRLFGRGVEDRFPDFAQYLAEHPEYGFGSTPEEVEAKYLELAARLDETPSPEGYNGQLLRQVVFANLYYDSELPYLAEILQAFDTGQPIPEPAAQTAATDPAIPADNYLASQLHVICNDSDWPESIDTYKQNVEEDRIKYPKFGAAGANITPCAFWPSEPIEPPVEITDEGPSNVLILHNLRDPATPLVGAQKLSDAFGDRARMITADQGGHLAYLWLDNPCANDLTTDFLVHGERPKQDVACGPA